MGYQGPMKDACELGTVSAPTGGGDPLANTPSYGSEIRCRYGAGSTQKLRDGSEIVLEPAFVDLPASVSSVKSRDKIRLTRRYNQTLNPKEVYEIDGKPTRFADYWRCLVKFVGSA